MNAENENLKRIQRISRRIQRVLAAAMFALPLALAAYWFFYNDLPAAAQAGARIGVLIVGPVAGPLRLLAFAITMISAGVTLWGCYTLRRLFRLYASGRIFDAENAVCFRRLGWIFIVQVLANLITVPGLAVTLSAQNPPGQKQLAFSIGSGELGGLLAGAMILVIAAVMEEGRKLEEDQRLTV